MTVSTTDTEASYTADGVQTNFTFAFVVQLAGDIDVYVDGVELVSGVTVNVNADQEASPGGSVDITPAPADQAVVKVKRDTPITQLTDYDAYGPFPSQTHEAGLDKRTLVEQELKSAIGERLIWVDAPASAGATGTAGQIAYASGYLYVCVATDTWQRAALSTWT
jgi:hypothetical protein